MTEQEILGASYAYTKASLEGAGAIKGDKGDPGVGVPTGGTTGQVLTKKSNNNYDTEWGDASGGGSVDIRTFLHNTGAGFVYGARKAWGIELGTYFDDTTKHFYFGAIDTSTNKNSIFDYDFSNPYNPVKSHVIALNDLYTFPSGTPKVMSIQMYGGYLFASIRSTSPNVPSDGMDNTSVWGAVLVLNPNDLSIVKNETYNAKCSCVAIHKATSGTIYMVVNAQMSYMKLYTISSSDATDWTLRDTQYFQNFKNVEGWTDYNPKIQEQQRGIFYETESGQVLWISGGFGDGVHIWDVTNIETERATLYDWSGFDHLDIWRLPNTNKNYYHAFDVAIEYPYVYASLGASSTLATEDHNNGTNLRKMGVLVLDITNLSNIGATVANIPIEDMNDYDYGGDPRPTRIVKVGNKLFLNNGGMGVAGFEISNPSTPSYIGTNKCFTVNALQQTEQNGLIVCEDLAQIYNSEAWKRNKINRLYAVD